MVRDYDDMTYTSEGQEHLEAALGTTGGIILMSHVGNWDVAAYLLKQKYGKLRLLLYMGIRKKEEIERIQKENLEQSGIRIVAVDQDGGSPFDIMKGIQFLKSGGMVSLTGDVLWKKDQRTVPVKIFGHEVHLPEIPYIFALLAGVPLFIFFAFRIGSKSYHFTASEPIYINAPSRADRSQAIQKSAQIYADLLERVLRQHPFEWYHFDPFFTPGSESNTGVR
jgi:predicted LPLAT superfamily acyltransferase